MSKNEKQAKSKIGETEALLAIGTFLGVFGITIIVAVFFTHTYHGKITNLICGGVLLLTSLLAIAKSKWNKKKKEPTHMNHS